MNELGWWLWVDLEDNFAFTSKVSRGSKITTCDTYNQSIACTARILYVFHNPYSWQFPVLAVRIYCPGNGRARSVHWRKFFWKFSTFLPLKFFLKCASSWDFSCSTFFKRRKWIRLFGNYVFNLFVFLCFDIVMEKSLKYLSIWVDDSWSLHKHFLRMCVVIGKGFKSRVFMMNKYISGKYIRII